MSDWWSRTLAMIRKELRATLKDPANRVILIVPALMQSLLFGYAATYDLVNVPYAVLDESPSASSMSLLDHLDGTGVFHRVATLHTLAELKHIIDAQQALMVIHIGPRFEQALNAGEPAPVQVILDARNSTTAGSAASDVDAVVAAFNAERRAAQGIDKEGLRIETRAWFNPNLETRWNIMTAMIAELSFVQTLLLAALAIAREREQGTFDQTLVTPLGPLDIMIGKAIPPMLIGLFQATIVLIVTRLWFKVPLAGSLGVMYGGLTLFVLASVGIGLSISALAANMQQAVQYTLTLVMPMVLLSGITTPVSTMPRGLQFATSVNPLRYGVHLLRRLYLEGVGVSAVGLDLAALGLIALLTLPTAARLFRRRLA